MFDRNVVIASSICLVAGAVIGYATHTVLIKKDIKRFNKEVDRIQTIETLEAENIQRMAYLISEGEDELALDEWKQHLAFMVAIKDF